jgi:long-chain acyl-CoA synthetase
MIFAENGPEYFFAFYGTIRCNAVVIPVDVNSTASEVAYIVADCKPDIIFISPEKKELVETACAQAKFATNIVSSNDIDISAVNTIEATELIVAQDDRTALLIYTSGTTGSPKGVMLSYKNVFFMINAVSKDVPIYTTDRNVMVLLPLHHSFPLLGTLVIPMQVGTTVYIAEGLNAESILKTLNDGKIAIIVGVPRLYETLSKGVMAKINAKFATKMIYKIAELIGSGALSKVIFKSVHQKFGGHIQYLVSGGAALPVKIAKIFKTLGFYILDGYGMTEASPMISFTHPGKWKIGYAGLPLKGTEIKIEPCGEICVRGGNVMQGYYNRPQETEAIIKDGWLHTGDIGFVNKHGVKITGRIKEILVTPNGKNINPEEIEQEVMQNTRYIKEIGVFMHDSVMQAIVVPEMKELRQSAESNLLELIRQDIDKFNKVTSVYKRIKRIHISSEELPKTRLSKIQRFCLPTLMEQKTKAQNAEEDTNQSKVYQRLKTFVESETGYAPRSNDHFEIDLSMDSLSRVALLTYVENSFGLTISEEELDTLNTLAKLTEYVEQNSPEMLAHKEISWKEILSAKIPNIKIPRPGIIHFMVDTLSKISFRTLYRFKGKGEGNIPNEPCIIAANHRSGLDGLIITSFLKRKTARNTFFFAKEKHWRTKFARFMAGKNNVLLMDINRNVKESLQQISQVLQQGKNVIIFPEGTRSRNKEMKPFKNAFAILSTELSVPVVPVVISGSDRAVFRPMRLPRFLTRIRVEFLQPIYPQPAQTAENLRDHVERQIKSVLNAR